MFFPCHLTKNQEASIMDSEPAGGDIVVYTKIRDLEARTRLQQLLDDLPGERVDERVYEVFTADWDEGIWDQYVILMQELVDPATDTLVFWRLLDGKLTRTSLAGRFT
jgi:hypothetical protein